MQVCATRIQGDTLGVQSAGICNVRARAITHNIAVPPGPAILE